MGWFKKKREVKRPSEHHLIEIQASSWILNILVTPPLPLCNFTCQLCTHIAVLYTGQLCPYPLEIWYNLFSLIDMVTVFGLITELTGIFCQAFWVVGDGVSAFISLPLFLHWAFQSLQWCLAYYLCHSIHYTCSKYSLHLWWLSRTRIAPVTHRQWTRTQRTSKYPLLFPFVPDMEANVPWIIYTSHSQLVSRDPERVAHMNRNGALRGTWNE